MATLIPEGNLSDIDDPTLLTARARARALIATLKSGSDARENARADYRELDAEYRRRTGAAHKAS
jgi:hypothetical protein